MTRLEIVLWNGGSEPVFDPDETYDRPCKMWAAGSCPGCNRTCQRIGFRLPITLWSDSELLRVGGTLLVTRIRIKRLAEGRNNG